MHTMRVVLAFVLAGFASVSSANAEGRRGAVVVAATTSAVVDAKVLARAIYREPQLRPALDEATARAVLGDEPASVGSAKNLELARVARAAVEGRDPAVSVRLLRSLGDELGAAALVIVAAPQPLSEQPVGAAAPSPSARVFLVGDGRGAFAAGLRSKGSARGRLVRRGRLPPFASTFADRSGRRFGCFRAGRAAGGQTSYDERAACT